MASDPNKISVRHLNLVASGGAAIAARRISDANLSAGMDSSFEILQPDIQKQEIIKRVVNKYDRHLANSAKTKYEFSILKSFFSASVIPGNEEIVNLHWVPGLHPRLNLGLKGLIKIQTLHDMNSLTGGCHHAFSCLNYLQNCGRCPQVNFADQPLVSAAFTMRKNFNNVQAYIAPSKWIEDIALSSPLTINALVSRIPNPIPDIFFSKQRKIRGGSNNRGRINVGVLGSNYNHNKNANKVIESINRVQNLIEADLQIHVLGNLHENCGPPQVQNLEAGASEEQVSDFLGGCDLFVYASLADTFPSILIEAQAMGVAVVAYDIGGAVETFQNEVSGLSVKNLSGELERTLVELLNDPQKIEEMKESAREIAKTNYSYKSIGKKHLELYTELISREKFRNR
jgi:glycosyltransferase involved in cell wall biosynthesis